MKPWHKYLDEKWQVADIEEFTEAMLTGFSGYMLWVKKDPEWWHGGCVRASWLMLGADGEIYWKKTASSCTSTYRQNYTSCAVTGGEEADSVETEGRIQEEDNGRTQEELQVPNAFTSVETRGKTQSEDADCTQVKSEMPKDKMQLEDAGCTQVKEDTRGVDRWYSECCEHCTTALE